MRVIFGQFPRTCLATVAALSALVACDPNVVIGSRWSHAGAGTSNASGSGSGSGGAETGGGGSGPVTPLGGTAGDTSAGGSEAGAPGAAGAEEMGGQAGESNVTPGLVFSADHENGSLSQWDLGADDDAGGYYADGALPTYSEEHAHSGDGSAKVSIDTSGPADQIARLYRRLDTEDAYYLAWFYLAEDHTPSNWWSIFLFRAVKERSDSKDLWSLNLVRTKDNKLTVALFDHQYDNANGRTINVVGTPPVVPLKQWFQVQAHLALPAGKPSSLTIWLDGVEVLSLANTTIPPANQPVYWVIGNGGAKMTPAVSTVYVDDAEISTSFVRP